MPLGAQVPIADRIVRRSLDLDDPAVLHIRVDSAVKQRLAYGTKRVFDLDPGLLAGDLRLLQALQFRHVPSPPISSSVSSRGKAAFQENGLHLRIRGRIVPVQGPQHVIFYGAAVFEQIQQVDTADPAVRNGGLGVLPSLVHEDPPLIPAGSWSPKETKSISIKWVML